MRRRLLSAAALVALTVSLHAQELSELKFASLGDFRLENGQVLRDCRIGYRTAGALNAERSNAIVFPSWFAGNSADLKSYVGRDSLLDSSRFFVIAVDALGDGVSSSPSNNPQRPFPQFSVRDIVRTQHELVTRELKLTTLFAVAGLSMGGMQALQWAVSYPEMMKRVVALSPTPKQTSADVILWKTQLDLLESSADPKPAMRAIAAINTRALRTPAWIAANVADGAAELEARAKALSHLDPEDYAAQLRAIIGHDLYRDFGGSAEAAARAIKARMLIGVALQDQMVMPGPARQLARIAGAEIFTLSGDCGHVAFGCEREVVLREVGRFFAAP